MNNLNNIDTAAVLASFGSILKRLLGWRPVLVPVPVRNQR